MSAIPVSVLILTLNEQENIARCVESVAWSDDVVVLDSGSTDHTVARARCLGARVHHRPFDDFASQRNHALESIEFKHDWVLHLDADEVVPAALREEIGRAAASGRFPAYRMASKLMFEGRWLRHAGMFPAYQVRLGRKDTLRFRQVGHGQRERLPEHQIGTLSEPCLHYGFSRGLADWIERHNRYSDAEAREEVNAVHRALPGVRAIFTRDATRRRRALKRLAAALPCRPTLRFWYMFLLRRGFLDGRAGWTYCRLLAMYEYWIVLKARELRGG